MTHTISVLCLSPRVQPVVERALSILNGAQPQFRFTHVAGEALPAPDHGEAYSFGLLDEFLLQEKQRLGAAYLLGVTDQPNERNYFSHSLPKERVGFLTTADWEYLSWVPSYAYVAYALVRNLVTMLGGRSSIHQETRGCFYDFCAHKPDYSFKIRTADVCPECLDFMRSTLAPEDVDAVVSALEAVRLAALGRGGDRESEPRSTAETVDRDYPFPIAYCFRSMQAELSYSRKWLKLLELYEVIIKYLTVVLISDLNQSRGGVPESARPHLAGLRRPAAGHWHRACFALVRACGEDDGPLFVDRFRQAAFGQAVRKARAASERLLNQRNNTRGHGFIEEDVQYQSKYLQHLDAADALVEFIRPLATYTLIKVGDGLKRRRGVSTFPAKVLMGSHPLFPVTTHETSSAVDTDCLLHDPVSKAYVSLYPWLILDHCKECFRETVFLFDRLEEEAMVVREYPTNHTQERKVEFPQELAGLIQ
ncbi:MAG: hypothetical protein U0835_05260 [Isosphaeraceae bacterium]